MSQSKNSRVGRKPLKDSRELARHLQVLPRYLTGSQWNPKGQRKGDKR